MRNIRILSAAQAETEVVSYRHVSISIGTNENIRLPENNLRKAELFLLFDDIDINRYSKYLTELPKHYQLFTNEQAREILEFTQKYSYDIVVNCEAGISRSSGVAAALGKIYNNDDNFVFNNTKYTPNMFVYSKLLIVSSYTGLF